MYIYLYVSVCITNGTKWTRESKFSCPFCPICYSWVEPLPEIERLMLHTQTFFFLFFFSLLRLCGRYTYIHMF